MLAAVAWRETAHGCSTTRPVAQRAHAVGQQKALSVAPAPAVAQSGAGSGVVPVPAVAQSGARSGVVPVPGVVPLVSMRAVVTFAAAWHCYSTTFLSSLPAVWVRRAAASDDFDLPAYWQSSGASCCYDRSYCRGWQEPCQRQTGRGSGYRICRRYPDWIGLCGLRRC